MRACNSVSECVATEFLGAAAAGAGKASGEVCGAGDGLAAGMTVGTGLGVGIAAVLDQVGEGIGPHVRLFGQLALAPAALREVERDCASPSALRHPATVPHGSSRIQ